MGKLLEKLDLVKKAGKIEIRGNRKFFNGNFAKFPILHRFFEISGPKILRSYFYFLQSNQFKFQYKCLVIFGSKSGIWSIFFILFLFQIISGILHVVSGTQNLEHIVPNTAHTKCSWYLHPITSLRVHTHPSGVCGTLPAGHRFIFISIILFKKNSKALLYFI